MSSIDEKRIKSVCDHIKSINKNLKEDDDLENTYDNFVKKNLLDREEEIKKIKSKIKYSIYLKEGEKFVSVFFKDEKNEINCPVFCKNTDKFMLAFNKLKNKYKQINENEYDLYFNKRLIELDKTFDENGLKNGDKINLIKKNVI